MFADLYFNQIDRFHESWLGCEYAGIEAASGSRNNLSTAAMNGIRVQRHVV